MQLQVALYFTGIDVSSFPVATFVQAVRQVVQAAVGWTLTSSDVQVDRVRDNFIPPAGPLRNVLFNSVHTAT